MLGRRSFYLLMMAFIEAFAANFSDFSPLQPYCHPFYGLGFNEGSLCLAALHQMPKSKTVEIYEVNPEGRRPQSPYAFPVRYVDAYSGCAITLEVAGPKLPRFIRTVPYDLLKQATQVFELCVMSAPFGRPRQGGFMTQSLDRLWHYVTDLTVNLDDAFPIETSFITVTVSTVDHEKPEPGNHDPVIPYQLSKYTETLARHATDRDQRSLLEARAARWKLRAQQMLPRNWNKRIDWWHDPYEADSQGSTASVTTPSILQLSNSTSRETQ